MIMNKNYILWYCLKPGYISNGAAVLIETVPEYYAFIHSVQEGKKEDGRPLLYL